MCLACRTTSCVTSFIRSRPTWPVFFRYAQLQQITEANACHSLSSPVYTQVLVLLHKKARLVHHDIKPANIQADLLPSGGTPSV